MADADHPDDTLDPSQLPTMPGAAVPRMTIGPYHLLQKIGEGGMGEVWLAQQERPVRRRVALKLIKAGMDTASVLARFDAERQALALMNHPSIARVFDAGSTEQGRPFFAMEHVDGEPITDYCDRQRLPMRERLDLFTRVCEGVQHAHQKGVIHRDLKPSNVLVRAQDDKPVPKIIDFGLAKAFDQRLTERTLYTELGAVVGTLEYMSPEQAEPTSADVDTRTDVYSLGVLLYVLLVGELPFDSATLRKEGTDEMRRTIRDRDPAKPSTRIRALGRQSTSTAESRRTDPMTLHRQLRGDLDAIVMKALEKDRTRRYDSASELAADIQRHLDHRPVMAAPPSPAYLAKKFVRRHRVGVAASALVLLVLVAATIVSTILFFRAEAARREAEFRVYTASLAAAAAALDLNDAAAVRRHLASTSEELRGFEWEWLWSEADRSLATTLELPPTKNGYCMRLSEDGRLVAARAAGGRIAPIRVYDARDGRQLHEFPTWESFASNLCFSPDGRLLAYGATSPGSVQIWDLTTGEERLSSEAAGSYESLLGFDAGGVHVALATSSTVVVVRLSDWAEVCRAEVPFDPSTTWGAFSPDGGMLVVSPLEAERVCVIDVPSGRILRELRGTGPTTTCGFSADGTLLAVLGLSQARLYDTSTWDLRTSLDKVGGYGALIGGDVAFLDLAGSGALVGAGRDGVLRAYRPVGPQPRGELRGEASPTLSIAWDPGAGRLVTVHARGVVHQWPLFPDWAFLRSSMARPLLFLPPKGLLAVGDLSRFDKPRVATLIDLDDPHTVGGWYQFAVTHAHSNAVIDAAMSPDGSRFAVAVASGWEQGRLKIFDAASGLTTYAPEVFWGHDPRGVAWSPDGTRVAVVGNHGLARVFAPEADRFVELWGHRGTVEDVAFSRDGRRVWTGGADGTLREWDPAAGTLLETRVAPDSAGITALALFEDWGSLVCGLATGGLALWDLDRSSFGDVLAAHSDRVEGIVRSPDGRRVVSGAVDGSILFWEPSTWRELLARRAEGGLTGLAFSPDGERLALGRTEVRVLDSRPEERRVQDRETHREARQAAVAWIDALEGEKLAPAHVMKRIEGSTAHGQPVKDAAVMELYERRGALFDAAVARAEEIAGPHVRRQILRDLSITPANDRFWLELSDAATEIRGRGDLTEIERDMAAEFALARCYDMHAYTELMGEGVWTNVLVREMLESPEAAPGDWALALFAAEELVFAVPSSSEFRETLQLAQRRTAWPATGDSLASLRAKLGVGDPNGAYAMQSLAMRQWERGDLVEAERLLKKGLDRRARLGGRHDRAGPGNLAVYAEILHATSRDEEAEELLREACALVREIRGEEHIDVALRDVDLGRFLCEMGRAEEAETLLRGAVERARRMQGDDHPDVAAALVALAEASCRRGDHAGAEPPAREALVIRQRHLDAADWRIGEAMSVLGEAVGGQRRFAEAEPLLREGHERLDARGRWEARRTAARERLAALYEAWGKPEEAVR
ncbi:MAG: protein kinase domain-containing protein [Candidatus Eiseniibacteriota bacterium]